MLNRRTFLKEASLVALTPTVPAFLSRTARAAAPEADGRVLVVIQLDGGNDGINTVVPFADEGYARNRQALRLNDGLLKISDELALHPSLRAAADLLEQQRLSIVQGVGYPNPNRSHAVSMSIWQTARFDREEHTGYGWIGRALDGSSSHPGGLADSVLIGEGAPPRALWGRRSVASSINTLDDLVPLTESHPGVTGSETGAGDLSAFLRRQTLDAYSTADALAGLARETSKGGTYRQTSFAGRLQLIARLVKADLGTRVYYTVQRGYDTHAVQLPAHARLLRELAGGLQAFLDDLRAAGLEERVLVMCFSEFGRRVAENASAGTDHGTAAPMLLAGGMVRAGVHGETPSLLELENGDLRHTVDFRSVYATVLTGWLGLPASSALGGEFRKLSLFQS